MCVSVYINICSVRREGSDQNYYLKHCFKFTSMARLTLFLSFLSLALVSVVNCRVLSSVSEDNNSSILVSDGVQDRSSNDFLSLNPPNLSESACVHVYGFLPCADNIEGYVFQVFSFGCLLIIGEYFLSKGRSKLFVIFEVGFFGGIIFPLLTMFPRIALILCKSSLLLEK